MTLTSMLRPLALAVSLALAAPAAAQSLPSWAAPHDPAASASSSTGGTCADCTPPPPPVRPTAVPVGDWGSLALLVASGLGFGAWRLRRRDGSEAEAPLAGLS